MKRNSQLIGAAGVHFVAARLNALEFHAAPTIRNVPGVDLLVSSPDGHKSAAIQVKTTWWASRTSGRGEAKFISRYEWSNNYVEKASPLLFYAFVDLKAFEDMPDIFILPSRTLLKWYRDAGIAKEDWKWPRFHADATFVDPYKNNFEPLFKAMGHTPVID